MANVRRVVFYAVDGSGMGHITRLLAVARWVRRYVSVLEEEVPEILFLTSSEATQILLDAGFASFKVPSREVVVGSGMELASWRRLARQFIWQMLALFAPDLLVVDGMPAGSFEELLQVLDGPFKRGLLLEPLPEEVMHRPAHRSALALYQAIAIPHDPEVIGAQPPMPNARFCGKVLQFERDELPSRAEARASLGVADGTTLVYVSAGGSGEPVAEATLVGLVEALRGEPGVHLLVGAGPLYRGDSLARSNVTVFTGPQVTRYLAGCDAAVAAGGTTPSTSCSTCASRASSLPAAA